MPFAHWLSGQRLERRYCNVLSLVWYRHEIAPKLIKASVMMPGAVTRNKTRLLRQLDRRNPCANSTCKESRCHGWLYGSTSWINPATCAGRSDCIAVSGGTPRQRGVIRQSSRTLRSGLTEALPRPGIKMADAATVTDIDAGPKLPFDDLLPEMKGG